MSWCYVRDENQLVHFGYKWSQVAGGFLRLIVLCQASWAQRADVTRCTGPATCLACLADDFSATLIAEIDATERGNYALGNSVR